MAFGLRGLAIGGNKDKVGLDCTLFGGGDSFGRSFSVASSPVFSCESVVCSRVAS
jgi:hypothetical protein